MKRKIKAIVSLAGVALPFIAAAQVQPPPGTGLPSSSIFDIIRSVMMWLLGLLGFFAVIGFVISGIMYIVAAGDEDAQKRAKRAMFYSLTGVIVGLIGMVVLVAVQRLLGGQQTQF